jgi:AcrR family transcriptional regulator
MTEPKVDGRRVRYQHRKAELLDAATEYVLANGLRNLSLRPIAEALGITHASLLRHFSSKDELVMAVLDRIRTDLTERLDSDDDVRTASTVVERIRAVWRRLCEPKEQRQFLLLFELVGQYGRSPSNQLNLARSVVQDWIDLTITDLVAEGWAPHDATAAATLLLAEIRGLQLDLLLTADRQRVDHALEMTLRALSSDSMLA